MDLWICLIKTKIVNIQLFHKMPRLEPKMKELVQMCEGKGKGEGEETSYTVNTENV